MTIEREGKAHKADIVHVRCDFCDTVVKFWRGEKHTRVDYVGEIAGGIFNVYWTCPVCGKYVHQTVGYYETDETDEFYGIGLEKGHVMSKEEKAEYKKAMKAD